MDGPSIDIRRNVTYIISELPRPIHLRAMSTTESAEQNPTHDMDGPSIKNRRKYTEMKRRYTAHKSQKVARYRS